MRKDPLALDAMEDMGEEWRWSVASVLGFSAMESRSMVDEGEEMEGMEVMRAVVSYEALAMSVEDSYAAKGEERDDEGEGEGIQHAELKGAVCPLIVWRMSLVSLKMRMVES